MTAWMKHVEWADALFFAVVAWLLWVNVSWWHGILFGVVGVGMVCCNALTEVLVEEQRKLIDVLEAEERWPSDL